MAHSNKWGVTRLSQPSPGKDRVDLLAESKPDHAWNKTNSLVLASFCESCLEPFESYLPCLKVWIL